MQQFLAKIARRLRHHDVIEGYEQPALVDVVFQKTAAYTADREWPEIAGATSVLDFGGGCGIHYKQAGLPNVRWAVVDTPMMVARASELATDKLKFFPDIASAAAWLGDIDVMHSNGALHYTPDPEQTLHELCGLRARRLMWDRMELCEVGLQSEIQSTFLSSNGPGGSIAVLEEKTVRYTRTKIPEQTFLDAHVGYELEARGSNWFRFRRP